MTGMRKIYILWSGLIFAALITIAAFVTGTTFQGNDIANIVIFGFMFSGAVAGVNGVEHWAANRPQK